jgi:hypothetical protein
VEREGVTLNDIHRSNVECLPEWNSYTRCCGCNQDNLQQVIVDMHKDVL